MAKYRTECGDYDPILGGLGVALNSTKRVVVLDGDGAALMKMGTLATVGAYGPENLIHIVLDNGTYDSTGGQPTVSASVDFATPKSITFTCPRPSTSRFAGFRSRWMMPS